MAHHRRNHRAGRRRLAVEPLENRRLLAPYGATAMDTGEYLLGDVLVTVVLFESDGSIDESTEDWTAESIAGVKQRITEGVNWWVDTLEGLPDWWYGDLENPPTIANSLSFQFDFTYADTPFETGYEPISRKSQEHVFPVRDFLVAANSWDESLGIEENIRQFNHAQRDAAGADWAFTIFIANDENDIDKKFSLDGQFLRAFSYPGGQYVVSPASRPASTFAHELGHQFWARDEYAGGGSYTDRRGYYNAANSNAADNPDLQFREPSIMARGELLDTAFNLHVSSRSSLEMVGWRDSDQDGVFDVLDVPLELEGIGRYDALTRTYRFTGQTSVQALPNLNSAGTGNDISTNEVTRAEYRVDGGEWTPAATIGAPTAQLDLEIPLNGSEQSLELRTVTVDVDRLGNEWLIAQSTPWLIADLTRPATVGKPGINGFVWRDSDGDGVWDASETTLPNWTVRLVDTDGNPIDLQTVVEPDDFPNNQDIGESTPGLRISAVGSGTQSAAVRVAAFGSASTGTKTFIHQRFGSIWSADWTEVSRRLRVDFDSPVTQVSLDAVAGTSDSIGRLDAYDAQGRIIARYTTGTLTPGEWETMTVQSADANIAYVIAGSHGDTSVRLDRLVVGPSATTVTDANGAYSLAYLPAGSYRVAALATADWDWTAPSSGTQDVVLNPGAVVRHVDFGGRSNGSASPWQNSNNKFDVTNDGSVTPRDALEVIDDLSEFGARKLPDPGPDFSPPPFLDVSGDGFVTPLDALMVISYLNDAPSAGSNGGTGGGASGGNGPEGEAPVESGTAETPRDSSAQQNQMPALGYAPMMVGGFGWQWSPFGQSGGPSSRWWSFDRPADRYGSARLADGEAADDAVDALWLEGSESLLPADWRLGNRHEAVVELLAQDQRERSGNSPESETADQPVDESTADRTPVSDATPSPDDVEDDASGGAEDSAEPS